MLMFDDIAATLLKMMSMSGEVPGRVQAKEIAAALGEERPSRGSHGDSCEQGDIRTHPSGCASAAAHRAFRERRKAWWKNCLGSVSSITVSHLAVIGHKQQRGLDMGDP